MLSDGDVARFAAKYAPAAQRVGDRSASAIWNGMALRIDRDSPGKICHAPGCTPGDLLAFVGRPTDEGSA